MGARFAHSVANLFMAHWGEESVFKNRPPELVCYRRFIDDLIMIWEGDMSSLVLFMQKLNITKNISPTWNVTKIGWSFWTWRLLRMVTTLGCVIILNPPIAITIYPGKTATIASGYAISEMAIYKTEV